MQCLRSVLTGFEFEHRGGGNGHEPLGWRGDDETVGRGRTAPKIRLSASSPVHDVVQFLIVRRSQDALLKRLSWCAALGARNSPAQQLALNSMGPGALQHAYSSEGTLHPPPQLTSTKILPAACTANPRRPLWRHVNYPTAG